MVAPLDRMVPRSIEELIHRRLTEEPVIILNGARTVGKSTLLHGLAPRLGASVIDLDDLATRDAVADDPGLFTGGSPPVLVDEFQHVPELLDAIKMELNRDLRPGRFVLTGSTRYLTLPRAAQSLTGRVHVMMVWPLAQVELEGRSSDLLTHLVTEPGGLVHATPSNTSRRDYVERILAGGFPLALQRNAGPPRSRWFRDYMNLVIERDVLDIRHVRQREVLPKLLHRLAAQTGQVLNMSDAARRVNIHPSVAEDYTRLLEAVFLMHRLPAWGRTLRSRVASLPKIHMVDSGLAAHLMGLTTENVVTSDPSLLAEFGHLTESFVVNEILKQAAWSDEVLTFGHFRTHDEQEVDLVAETDDGRVAGIEVKAGGRVKGSDFRGLRVLRERLGTRFIGGLVLHMGERSYTHEDRLYAMPIDRLWA